VDVISPESTPESLSHYADKNAPHDCIDPDGGDSAKANIIRVFTILLEWHEREARDC
jgi:hypothetical protein